MAYEYVEFPKCMYHATKGTVDVADADAQKALGPEWFETSTEAKAALKSEPKAEEKPKKGK